MVGGFGRPVGYVVGIYVVVVDSLVEVPENVFAVVSTMFSK